MHYYGMRLRGYAPGCQPKGVKEVVELDASFKRKYWDVISYDRKLTEEEVKNYELDYLGEMSEKGE